MLWLHDWYVAASYEKLCDFVAQKELREDGLFLPMLDDINFY